MGWMFTHRPKGTTDREFFSSRFDSDAGHIVDIARHGFNTVYIAYWSQAYDATFAIICLIKNTPKEKFNFGYKDIDEFMGSYEYHCPERILKLLSPLDVFKAQGVNINYAETWRNECWANIRRKKARGPLSKGRVFRLPSPLNFTGGGRYDTFCVASSRPLLFYAVITDPRTNGETHYYLGPYVRASRKYFEQAVDVTDDIMPQIKNPERLPA